MHFLITRPKSDAAELLAPLEALGHQVSVEPLLQIVPMPIEAGAFEGAQGLIATSRNALRALADSEALKAALRLTVFAVGDATAETARSLGFDRVSAGPGTARDLVPLIAAQVDPARGPLVHVAGETLAFDLAKALAGQGIAVRKLTAYRAVAAARLTPVTAEAIAAGTIEAVILMSPRTAAIFSQLVGTMGLEEKARRLTFVCLSAAVAEKLAGLAPSRVVIAALSNAKAMIDAAARVATPTSGV